MSSSFSNTGLLAALLSSLLVSQAHAEADPQALTLEAQGKIKTFASSMQQALKAGIQSGGLGEGISICHDQADALAEAASVEGWQVARTTLKQRNPANAPDAWEQAQLQNFAAQQEAWLASGKPLQMMSASQIEESETGPVFRYMQVIPTGDVCLKCHGSNLSAEVTEKLESLYPDDQAVGYQKGDIRGAFTLQKQL